MTAADINSVVDNIFWWIIGIGFLLVMCGAFDKRGK